ncbi:MAG: ribonuclease Y [Candidatus Latescibacteria bacterium]|nr:ribonuclease Y [Candidatus Latescibacterota bacterium]
MMAEYLVWFGVMLVALLSFAAGWIVAAHEKHKKLAQLEEYTEKRIVKLVEEADRERKVAFLDEKNQWYKTKARLDREYRERHTELDQCERELTSRERLLDERSRAIDEAERLLEERERDLETRETSIVVAEERLSQGLHEYRQRLEQVAGLTIDEAKSILCDSLREEVEFHAVAMEREIIDRAKENADREAKKIIALAIERCAADDVIFGATTVVVPLSNDETKSRIIGKEGRNIRAFEIATGVKVVVDDTPGTVLLSCFDPIKREVAKMAMAMLIQDGRINPVRIEEIITVCRHRIDELVIEEGRKAFAEIDTGDAHLEIIKLVGMLKYRSSYGQNLLQHSKEVAWLAGAMAAELGMDSRIARRAGLLHDIGKAIDRQVEGTHPEIGLKLARLYGEPQEVQEAIASHHEDVEPTSPISFLVSAADAISGARPGARREDLEAYAKRIKSLEDIANSFDGIKDVYAINAGREVRVIASADVMSDEEAKVVAMKIARRIRSEMIYSGQVKVVVIREVRAIEYTGIGGKMGGFPMRRRSHEDFRRLEGREVMPT